MRHLIFLLLLSISFIGTSQEKHCQTDEMHQRLFMGFPQLHEKITANANELERFTANFKLNSEAKTGVLYTIPVVFHVIHNYGGDNISDAQINDQVRILNEDFQKLNADTGSIVTAFQSIAADCQMEFKLAKQDPNGKCTNGITRHGNIETTIGDHAVKDIVHWDPSMYLNVYIVQTAAGLAGHALVPSAADTIPEWDGIVLAHNYCGSIGTSTPFRSTVLTHEIGHYLNLQHTWGGNNVPNYPYLEVAQGSNCGFDDGVLDTPETIGWQTCNLSGTSCGTLDNLQNYMEYAYCAIMFTEGQKTRMHAALNSSIANRNNLWSPSNLTATGVNDLDQLCLVDFDSDKQIACVGDTIWFSDKSFSGITSRTWTFNGATISTQSDSLTFAVYNIMGDYDVTLNVSDGNTTVDTTKYQHIIIQPAIGINEGIQDGFESYTSLLVFDWNIKNNDEAITWDLNTGVGYEGTNSAYIDNLNNLFGQKDELFSAPINVSNFNEVDVSFKYAYAKRTTTSSDKLSVLVSKDCGETWVLRKTLTSFTLNSVNDTLATAFSPNGQSEWKTSVLTNIANSYLVDNLMVKFIFENGDGNNIYIDNINVYDPTTVDIGFYSENDFKIFPNPVKDNFSISKPSNFEIEQSEIWSTNGQLIATFNKMDSYVLPEIAEGLYFLKIKGNNQVITLPFSYLK